MNNPLSYEETGFSCRYRLYGQLIHTALSTFAIFNW